MPRRKRTQKAKRAGSRTKRAKRTGGARSSSRITRSAKARRKTGAGAAGARKAAAIRPINAALKAAVLAVEPPINRDRAALDQTFVLKLDAALADLNAQGTPFKLVEGFRTTERQQWLFGSGRRGVEPHGRPGPILTNADGVSKLSRHQGTGVTGSGRAADCYPMKDGKVFIPPNTDPVWSAYAAAVVAQGLVAGHNFKSIKDSPHCELA
jgi:hypothetical protein